MTNAEAITRIKDHIVVHRYLERNAVKILEALDMAIKSLEQPERERGYWIYKKDEFDGLLAECSVCHVEGMLYGNFCPNCGARMDGKGGDGNEVD